MKFDGAVVKEQGVTFAIIVVKQSIINSTSRSEEAILSFMNYFPGMPVTLMAQDTKGVPQYRGRRDIVDFLASIHPSRIPWKTYTFS
ncbi:hypothetical protein L1077_16605 [Pseudoalteromonas luteoviolacea]|uniref:hypothetical protein n=1 Tax=Pseudoalteromonas luteoviolacea TaxID=43657 RepID=UPI001F2DF67A|nr:hypothetical protein [Pseudoalteromonas luteoviolacea]MCF6441059.1 hypothetical protein [Pseudoalteromonas luteoviolacea]